MKKKQIIILSISLFLITIALLGLAYAYYKTKIVGNNTDKSISSLSKKLEITYTDGNGVIKPTEQIEPGYTVTKTFSVENTGDEKANYSIKLNGIINTFERTEDWTYVLKKGDNELTRGTLPTAEIYILNAASIDPKTTDTYSLTITYANLTNVDQSIDMGKSLSLRVNIDNAKITWNSALEGMLLYSIKNDNTIKDPLTTPGNETSSETEAVLSRTEDDYGDSYYYRGNVKNNFVNFSGMCFRIVRIQGDGSIKITLADRDHECNSSDYTTSSTDSAFISTDTYSYKMTPSNTIDDLKYETSDLKTILEAWLYGGSYTIGSIKETFEKKIDNSKLIETEWCNDMSISEKKYYDENYNKTDDATKAIYSEYDYGAYDRMYTKKTPTLKCNMKGLDNTVSLKIKSKIGLLTADEVAFAGGSYLKNNLVYYLKDNGNKPYWTMSPSYLYYDGNAIVWFVGTNGNLSDNFVYRSRSVRPVIALRSDVQITSGNGTQANPYIIK